MSDFLSHLVSSALGTGHPVQPMFAPQAPPPEGAPTPELPPAPLAPPSVPSSELAPPGGPRSGSRAGAAPVAAPVSVPIPDSLPFAQREDPVRSVRSPDSLVEKEDPSPPTEARGAEGSTGAPLLAVAPRHVPSLASAAARDRGRMDAELDAELDPEPADPRASVPREARSVGRPIPSRQQSIRAAKTADREQREPIETSEKADRKPQEFARAAERTDREPEEPSPAGKQIGRERQESLSPVQSPIRNRAELPAEPERPFQVEDQVRPAFADSAGGLDRQEEPSAPRPRPEPPRRLDQAPERRRIEREATAPSAAPQPVQIRIGRIEVRAVRPSQPAAPVPAPSPAPSAPPTSLPDYLRKQRGRS